MLCSGHVYCRECALQLCGAQARGRCCICRSFFSPLTLMAVPLPAPLINIDFEREFRHSAKTERLLTEIDALRREDPTIKSLIFSQWTSMLDIVEIPLNKQGYKFLRLDGSARRPTQAVQRSWRAASASSLRLSRLPSVCCCVAGAGR
jgi:SNF2 family DNA or RNA helicase